MKGTTPLLDQRLRHRLAVDCAVHRPLEQDRADHLAAAKQGEVMIRDAHLVDEAEHLLVGGPCVSSMP